jgi:hypothetical protein
MVVRLLSKRCSLLAAALLLAVAPGALAADGTQVLDCIKRVGSASWASAATRELIAAVACKGAADAPIDTADFDRRVQVVRDCFEKVVAQSRASGLDAELIAATACVGAVDAEETATCVEKVSRKLQHATGAVAELLAAQACARGNPAEQTADCVGDVAFRLTASGTTSEVLAATACGR